MISVNAIPQQYFSPQLYEAPFMVPSYTPPVPRPVVSFQPQIESPGGKQKRMLTHLGLAAGLFAAGLAMRRLPITPAQGFKYFSTDWKEWTKIGLGVLTVGEVNKAFNWNPEPWVGALQSVAVINALIAPLTKKSLGQTALLAPLVAGLVQGTHELDKRISPVLKENLDVPEWVTRLGISAASIVLGVNVFPPVYRAVAKTGVLGQQAKADSLNTATRALLGSEVAVCSRGCCRAMVCLNEVADFIGGAATWIKSRTMPQKSA